MKDLARWTPSVVRRQPRVADAALAFVLAIAALVAVAAFVDDVRTSDPSYDPPGWPAIVLVLLGITIPLAWRRRFPLSVAVIVTAAFVVGLSVVEVPEGSISYLAVALAIYSAAAHGQRPWRTPVLAVCVGAIVVYVAHVVFFDSSADEIRPLLQTFLLAYNAVLFTLPWGLGAAIRSLRESRAELADRAVELQAEREENARQAVFAERVRIARELHDVVAHHVSVMGIQAGAARTVMERQPDKAAAALNSIEASSRQAVVELHRLLGFLRRTGDTDQLTPQPDLSQLDDLIAQHSQDELAVELSIEGDARPLPRTLEVSAYRVIQEALTNTRKHSGAANATVRVRYQASTLDIDVLDNGTGRTAPPAITDGGHGLIGMRERTALHGGHLRAGPRPNGGFAVHASFPLNGAVP